MTSTDDEHDPEGTTIAFERAQVRSLLDQAKTDRAALQDATARLADDANGVCAHCQECIGVERLLVLSWATRCITCANT